jgi:hypothetical protein
MSSFGHVPAKENLRTCLDPKPKPVEIGNTDCSIAYPLDQMLPDAVFAKAFRKFIEFAVLALLRLDPVFDGDQDGAALSNSRFDDQRATTVREWKPRMIIAARQLPKGSNQMLARPMPKAWARCRLTRSPPEDEGSNG